MSGQRSSQVTDEYGRGLPGAVIYVYDNGGNTAATFSDAGLTVPLAQPILTDAFGGYTYYAPDGFYTEEIWYGGKRRERDRGIPVGAAIGTLAAEATTRANAIANEAATRAAADASLLTALSGASFSSATLTAVDRTFLAALDTSRGLPARLDEPGRQGNFTSAALADYPLASSDTYQGLYVISTFDPTKVWVRDVHRSAILASYAYIYQVSWWDPAQLGNNAHTVLRTIDPLLPATGCELVFPAATITISGNVPWFTDNLTIRGLGFGSYVKWNTGASITNLIGMFVLRGAHQKVENMRFSGVFSNLSINNPSVLFWMPKYGLYNGVQTAGTVQQRLDSCWAPKFKGIWIDNATECFTCAGSYDNSGTNNADGTAHIPGRALSFEDCWFFANYQSLVMFTQKDVSIVRTRLDNSLYAPNPATFATNLRVLGSQNVKVDNCELIGMYSNATQGYNVIVSFGLTNPGTRVPTSDVTIKNSRFRGAYHLLTLEECYGEFAFESNQVDADGYVTLYNVTTDNTNKYMGDGAVDAAYGIQRKIERPVFADNRIRNYEGAAYLNEVGNGTLIQKLHCKRDILTKKAGSAVTAFQVLTAAFRASKVLAIEDCEFWMKSSGFDLNWGAFNLAGEQLIVRNNLMPEYAGGNQMIVNSGAGTVTDTRNERVPAGTCAAMDAA